jgi:hypothetical protein
MPGVSQYPERQYPSGWGRSRKNWDASRHNENFSPSRCYARSWFLFRIEGGIVEPPVACRAPRFGVTSAVKRKPAPEPIEDLRSDAT